MSEVSEKELELYTLGILRSYCEDLGVPKKVYGKYKKETLIKFIMFKVAEEKKKESVPETESDAESEEDASEE